MVPFSLSSVSFGNVCIQMILFGIGSLCCSLINKTELECHSTETDTSGSTFRLRMDDGTFILADPRSNPSCAFPPCVCRIPQNPSADPRFWNSRHAESQVPAESSSTAESWSCWRCGAGLPLRGIHANTTNAVPRAKSVLIVLLSGGPSQLDTLDPKPEAPAEIRGEFSAIPTCVPGISICEHLPLLAARMDRWAILRTMAHKEHNHLLATHIALTGRPTPLPRGGSDLDRVESRNDFPNFAAALDFVKPRTDGIPSGVSLPNYLIEGPLTWPGQHAGFLGTRHDPWVINHDPNDPAFKVDSLTLPSDMSDTRLVSRRALLDGLNRCDASCPVILVPKRLRSSRMSPSDCSPPRRSPTRFGWKQKRSRLETVTVGTSLASHSCCHAD